MMLSQGSPIRILLLGGTTEASLLAHALAARGLDAVFSYAGRTNSPVPQPLPMRHGGFGGVAGLIAYLRAENITHILDATHPFAANMSRNAIQASHAEGLPLLALERPPWCAGPGDLWTDVADVAAAVAALPRTPARVFLAIGKQLLQPFAALPQHYYLLRLVDRPETMPLPNAHAIIAKGPFEVAVDVALLQAHQISHIVAKNAGGQGAEAKIIAARTLGLRVIMIARPIIDGPPRQVVPTVGAVLDWLGHRAERGV